MLNPQHSTPLSDAATAENSAGFALAYNRYAPLIYGLLLSILKDAEDARDVLQETFLSAWANVRRFDAARGSETAWLVTIARSRGIDRLRSRQRRALREEEAGSELGGTTMVDPAQGEAMLFRESRAAILDALQELPPAQRTALELAYFEGLSQSQIAARLGEPLGTIKTRTQLAIKRLRHRLSTLRPQGRTMPRSASRASRAMVPAFGATQQAQREQRAAPKRSTGKCSGMG